jgi:hypothetical protein
MYWVGAIVVLAFVFYGLITLWEAGPLPRWLTVPGALLASIVVFGTVWSLFYTLVRGLFGSHNVLAAFLTFFTTLIVLAGPIQWVDHFITPPKKEKKGVIVIEKFVRDELIWAPFRMTMTVAGVASIPLGIGLVLWIIRVLSR